MPSRPRKPSKGKKQIKPKAKAVKRSAVIDEHMHRNYTKEEDFLAEFYNLAPAAAMAVGDEWYPRADCDDDLRKQHQYFLSTGELPGLVFDSAASYHGSDGFFSSVVITLRSPKRVVSVRVRPEGKGKLAYAATIEIDRAL